MFSGRLESALEHATENIRSLPETYALGLANNFPVPKELVLLHFGRWEEALHVSFAPTGEAGRGREGEKRTANKLQAVVEDPGQLSSLTPFHRVAVLHARVVALAALRRPREARGEATSSGGDRAPFSQLQQALAQIPPDQTDEAHHFHPYHREIGRLYNLTASAALHLSEGDYATSTDLLDMAVSLQVGSFGRLSLSLLIVCLFL
jgi:hypothetical protein